MRTVERDVARLRDAGVPIVPRSGPGGGYAFGAGAALGGLELTAGEAAALVVALVEVGPSAAADARTGLGKLLRALDGG